MNPNNKWCTIENVSLKAFFFIYIYMVIYYWWCHSALDKIILMFCSHCQQGITKEHNWEQCYIKLQCLFLSFSLSHKHIHTHTVKSKKIWILFICSTVIRYYHSEDGSWQESRPKQWRLHCSKNARFILFHSNIFNKLMHSIHLKFCIHELIRSPWSEFVFDDAPMCGSVTTHLHPSSFFMLDISQKHHFLSVHLSLF